MPKTIPRFSPEESFISRAPPLWAATSLPAQNPNLCLRPEATTNSSSTAAEANKSDAIDNKLEEIKLNSRVITVIGRFATWSHEILQDSSVSRQHAALIITPPADQSATAGLMIVDLFSSHFTLLNGHKLPAGEPVPLYDQDFLQFGNFPAKFQVFGLNFTRKQRKAEKLAEKERKEQNLAGNKRRADENHSIGAPHHKIDRPSRVRVRHILAKHRNSRRPASHRQEIITISKEEALQQIQGHLNQLKLIDPSNFAALDSEFQRLASEFSDCSSYKRGGDLGAFEYHKMQPSFSAASFALKVGELSEPVESDSGVHIILRIE
jgi:NIMA-interacting peptidyl-prolyl cis-trans isomerase 1